jgi:hypothetical protein
MRRVALVFGVVITVSLAASTVASAQAGEPVCHEGQVIQPDDPEYDAHVGHGDPPANPDGTCPGEPGDGDGGGGDGGAPGQTNEPGCNGTVHLSGTLVADNGTEPKYELGSPIFAHGRNFDADSSDSGTYSITDLNDQAVLTSGNPWSAPSGSFDVELDFDGSPEHEYKVEFFWTEAQPNGEMQTCVKSKNFFLVTEAGAGVLGASAGGVLGTGAGGGGTGGDLPYTGLPAWVALLAGLSLLGLALGARLRTSRG